MSVLQHVQHTENDKPEGSDPISDKLQVVRQLCRERRTDLALSMLDELLEQSPEAPAVYLELANTLLRVGKLDEAIVAAQQSLAVAPDYADGLTLLVALLLETGRAGDALAQAMRLGALLPQWAEAWRLAGEAAFRLGRLSEAQEYLERAVSLRPIFPEANVRLAEVHLKLGNYADGWRLYEWRWQCKGYHRPDSNSRVPIWTGAESLEGRRIVIVAEQGMGDLIQYVRYARLLRARGAEVIVTCHGSLVSLLKSVDGVALAVPFGMPVPPSHFQIPLLSLPHAMGTLLNSVPAHVPYLRPNPTIARAWRERIAGLAQPGTKRVGFVWSGHVEHVYNPFRSVALADTSPLFAVPGITWFSLQVGPRVEDLAREPLIPLIDLSPHLTNFEETAAAIEALDLVISVDTAVAHLTGALNRPGWVLLHGGCDARWRDVGEHTPWYPSLTLLRQELEGNWPFLIERTSVRLQAWV